MKTQTNCRNCFKSVIAIIMTLIVCDVSAQSVQKPTDATVSFDTLSTATFYVELPDTNAVASLEVGMGNTPGMADIVSHTFSYDVTIGLPSGMAWTRLGAKVYLSLGTITPPAAFFARVRIQNHTGSWSNYYQFLAN
jgi:hypothetical protein